jgi:hypothetical protein
MNEYGYDTVMLFPTGYCTTTAPYDALGVYLNRAEEHGIGVLFSSQTDIFGENYGGSDHVGWTVGQFEAAYGEAYDIIDADSRIVGYFGETPRYTGWQWLRGLTSKIMTLDYYATGAACGSPDLTAHISDMAATADEVVFEVFDVRMAAAAVAVIPTLYAANHNLKVGVWDQTLRLWSFDYELYWGSNTGWSTPYTGPPVPYDVLIPGQTSHYTGVQFANTSKELCTTWLGAINAEMQSIYGRKLDFTVIQYYDCNETIDEAIEWHESLNLLTHQTPAFKRTQNMSQSGINPYYLGASDCTYPPLSPLVDTFTNTGNEIILIKSIGACSVHTILVNNYPYTMAIPPDHGIPLGPFPVRSFGKLPTITYDNTNLYISIIEDDSA